MKISSGTRAALWMVLAAALFSAMAVCIRMAAAEVHPLESVFFRNFVSLLLLMPYFWRRGFRTLKTQRFGLHVTRAMAGLVATFLWFSAMAWMPLAEATAISFTAPLFTTILAALFLSEIVTLRRWSGVLIGLLGALIILRPGVQIINPVALIMLGGAFFISVAAAQVKALTRTEHPDTIVFYLNALTTPASFVAVLFVWKWPSIGTLMWLIGVGVCAFIGHLAYTRAYAAADASAVTPYDYSRLIFTAALAFAFFGEMPDIWVWIGSIVIASATIFIVGRQ